MGNHLSRRSPGRNRGLAAAAVLALTLAACGGSPVDGAAQAGEDPGSHSVSQQTSPSADAADTGAVSEHAAPSEQAAPSEPGLSGDDPAALLFGGPDPREDPSTPEMVPEQVPLIRGNIVGSNFSGLAEEDLAYGTWDIDIVMGLGPAAADPLRQRLADTGFTERSWERAPDGTVDASYASQKPRDLEVVIRIGPYDEIPDAVPAADLSIDPESWYVHYTIVVPPPENY